MRRNRLIVALALAVQCHCGASRAVAAAKKPDKHKGELVQVITRKAKRHVGEFVSKDDGNVTLRDLVTNREMTVLEKDISKVHLPATIDEATRIAGLPPVIAWKVRSLWCRKAPVGKIAKVTSHVVYITLGKRHGLQTGTKLTVYRNEGEIRDPDTNELLGVERPKIAELTVVEVSGDRFSKSRIASEMEVKLLPGDEVELPTSDLRVAVCPIYHDNGSLTDVGSKLSEDMTTLLVQREIPVVERSVLDTVLPELLMQNTILFDPKTAQKIGKLAGASAVVTGKIVPHGRRGTAYIRLVDVATAEILFAASGRISLSKVNVVAPARSESSSSTSESGASRSNSGKSVVGNLGRSRRLPKFLTTQARLKRTKDGGVRILGGGPVQTRDRTFLNKDFTFEVLVSFEHDDTIAYIGLGAGKKDRSYNALTDSIYMRFHPPHAASGMVDVESWKKGRTGLQGGVTHKGRHMVRIIKEEDSVTFQVDPDNDGPTDDDLELTVPDIRELAPYLHSKNCNLFFGGGGTYHNVRLTR